MALYIPLFTVPVVPLYWIGMIMGMLDLFVILICRDALRKLKRRKMV